MTITERLEVYMIHKGLNANRMTTEAGLSIGLIGRAIKNNTTLNSETIEKILHAYPDLNPEWLLLEQGDMIKSAQNINSNQSPGSVNSNINGVNGNVSISQNDFSSLLDAQKAHREMASELIARLKASQEQLTESQFQIKTLLEIIQKKI